MGIGRRLGLLSGWYGGFLIGISIVYVVFLVGSGGASCVIQGFPIHMLIEFMMS